MIKRPYRRRFNLELPPFEKDPRCAVFFSLADFAFDPVLSDVLDENYEEALIAEGFPTAGIKFLPAHCNKQPKWLRQFQRVIHKTITLKEEEELENGE